MEVINMENNISELRRKKKISQQDLAKKLNIDRTHLSKIENGHVRPSTRLLERIAAELGVSVRDFF